MGDSDVTGWYRVCLNTIVRKGAKLDSDRLRILPMGSRVHVVGSDGNRRVKISQPVQGWCSLQSSTGDTILSKIAQDAVSETPRAGKYANLSSDIQKLKGDINNATDADQKKQLEEDLKEKETQKKDMEMRLNAMSKEMHSLQNQLLGQEGTSTEVIRVNDIVKFKDPEIGIGVVRFVGEIPHPKLKQTGIWVGVEFANPVGDSNGIAKFPDGSEFKLFKDLVPDNFASFVQPKEFDVLSGESILKQLVALKTAGD